ncbi:TPA: MaoC family dehydratase N-terminal domain-containing protein [Pseudomonas aeruginosa]|nr:MaoC family dehydratase N-terminal domain-containing protein [Pseudomonas aeruginosa]HEJ3161376.1 MaoC family dehydratase N-terminal domain-containing protein [Pseudomonas aeruginosa]
MALDHHQIGLTLPAFEVNVDPAQVAAFNLAIGNGRDDQVPLTFMKVLEGAQNSSRRIVEALGIDLRTLLHVEQQFDYAQPLRAGERVTITRSVSDIYPGRKPLMTFVVIESVARRADEALVCTSRQILLIREPREPVA